MVVPRHLTFACALLALTLVAKCHQATAGGLDLGADTAFDPCAEPLPSRESYLATVIGPDAEQVYAMQLQYHAWLCDDAAPATITTPPVIRLTEVSDDDKLHWVFPGDNHHPSPAPVPLPATASLLTLALMALGRMKPPRG